MMSIFRKIKHKKFREYVDIIEWINNNPNNLIWQFPRYKSKVLNGAQLIVGKTQVAVLISNGQYADVYEPGIYRLIKENMPITSSIKKWKQGFKSPFKVDIYFINTKVFWNIQWNTINSILITDPKFGSTPIHASGLFCFKVSHNPINFIRKVTEGNNKPTPDKVSQQLHCFVTEVFSDYLIASKITIPELMSSLKEFSNELTIALENNFADFGLELIKFSVNKIILPEDVRRTIDTKKNTN